MSDEWNVKNGVRQGGTKSWILLNVYLNEVMTDVSKLQAGCTLNCSEINIIRFVDDLVLFAQTAQALQFLLNAITSKLYTQSVQVNVQK